MFEQDNGNEAVWIALIGSAAAILAALRADKWPGYFIGWYKEKTRVSIDKTAELEKRIDDLEKELAKERSANERTQTILSSMLPLIKAMMKDNRDHINLLEQLENTIFNKTPADGV
jgi:uncharacterized coiled-coil protein SlyX